VYVYVYVYVSLVLLHGRYMSVVVTLV